jgi:DNA primase catalytic subunit
MNEIKIDWLLDSCFYNCFVCGEPFSEPPRLDGGGVLHGRALIFEIIVDEYRNKEETEERICNKCWVSDLSRFADNDS